MNKQTRKFIWGLLQLAVGGRLFATTIPVFIDYSFGWIDAARLLAALYLIWRGFEFAEKSLEDDVDKL